MLQIWEVLLQLPEGQRLHQSFGSVLHGALMQYAHTDFAEAMHRSALRRSASLCITIRHAAAQYGSLRRLTKKLRKKFYMRLAGCRKIYI